MKKKNLIIFFTLIMYFVLPTNVLAITGPHCKVIENGTEKGDKEAIGAFEKKLKTYTEELNNNYGQAFLMNYKYSYNFEIIENVTDATKTNDKTIEVEQLFNNQNEALTFYNSIDVTLPYVKGNYFINSIKLPNTIHGDNKQKICSSINCENEINELNFQLEKNQKLNYNIEISDIIDKNIIEHYYTENNVEKIFDTINEADEFAKNYNFNLNGFKFIKYELIPFDVKTTIIRNYNELNDIDTFNTLEEANQKLNSFKSEYPNAVGIIEKINNGQTIKNHSLEFSSKNNAEKRIEELEKQDNYSEITLKEVKKEDEKENINQTFSSLEDAQNAILELEKNGYIVNSKIDKVRIGITGNVESGISHDKNSMYVFPNDTTNFVLIKQGSELLAVWSENELNEEEKNIFVNSYNSVNSNESKFDGSTTNISKEQIIWIDGFKSHDLTNVAKNFGVYTFSTDGKNIILTCNKDKISHAIQGFATEKYNYVLSGTKYKEISTWIVEYVETINNYLYKINASASIEVTNKKYKILTSYAKILKESTLVYSIDTTYEDEFYTLTYNQYIPIYTDITTINWSIERCEYPYGNGNVDDYILPPKTGNNNYHNLLLTIVILIVSFGKKRI